MNLVRLGLPVALAAMSTTAAAALVDLSSWTAQGGSSNWQVAADKNSVLQSVNGNPTVFFSGSNDRGNVLSGKIRVQTTSDDDFIGFVLGYKSGDASAASTDFILIDWKQATQVNGNCTGKVGLAISRVAQGLADGSGTWCHDPAKGVTELARGTTLGSTGWADNTEYLFDLVFTATNIQVKVDGTTELNVNGSFADGSFGFYNYSQQSVRYSAITEDVAPPTNSVPEPGVLALLGIGLLAGIGGVRRRKA
ncbi:PEP-CTERM sorting domain-containing protein [Thauera sp.]|uniref:PEP-CTERM sorting domain-containing protein n=1 Tax=Thauera sp. TaxID=1905334 RepID=UPI002BB9DF96|nr:PEP-CTERM sorting domain-containing protein [Thauera sp.]HRO37353.1 PEP-CTERM sorting domain-containing protein [Thauera sp.]